MPRKPRPSWCETCGHPVRRHRRASGGWWCAACRIARPDSLVVLCPGGKHFASRPITGTWRTFGQAVADARSRSSGGRDW